MIGRNMDSIRKNINNQHYLQFIVNLNIKVINHLFATLK